MNENFPRIFDFRGLPKRNFGEFSASYGATLMGNNHNHSRKFLIRMDTDMRRPSPLRNGSAHKKFHGAIFVLVLAYFRFSRDLRSGNFGEISASSGRRHLKVDL